MCVQVASVMTIPHPTSPGAATQDTQTTKMLVTAIKLTHLIQIFQEQDQCHQLQATHPNG
jgi:hypothetical protein